MPTGTEQYYSGAVGIVKTTIGSGTAVDWNVSEWDAEVKANLADTTTTKLWNATKGELWHRRQKTSMDASGSFKIFHDKTNPPGTALRPGNVVNIECFTDDADELSGPVVVDSLSYASGGMDGIQAVTVKWQAAGIMLLPGDVAE